MDVFQFIINLFFGSFLWIIHFIEKWHKMAADVGFVPSKVLIFFFIIFSILIVGSSMFAMTVAEIKNRNRLVNGVIGAFLPVVYPILMYFVMPKYKMSKENDKEKVKSQRIEPLPPQEVIPKSNIRSIQKADKKGIDPSAMAIEETMEYNEEYFAHIMKDESGNFAGPFIFELQDGKILEVQRIAATMPNATSIVLGTSNEDERTIRLPYDKIQACHLKSDWIQGEEFDEDY
jgi:hypothetical protein